MRSIIILAVIAVSLGFIHQSFAVCSGGPTEFVCDTAPPNPDPNGVQQGDNPADLTITVLPGAEIDTRIANGGSGDDAIEYGAGTNEIRITYASVFAEDDTINASQNLGSATILIENSNLFALENDVIDLGNVRSNVLTIKNSNLRTDGDDFDRVLNSGQVDDTVNISGSTLSALDGEVLNMRTGNDDVTLSNTILELSSPDEHIIELDGGDDTLTLFNGVVLERPAGDDELIDCGQGVDTIVFAMNVPQKFLAEAKARLAEATLPNGAIAINGLFYDWENCEQLVDELRAGPTGIVRPIPTLSQWGLIVMAGVIGFVGLIAVRRKYKVTA